MNSTIKDCTGCAHTGRRFKFSKPRLWCKRYHCLADSRCIDYHTKPTAIQAALAYLKAGSLK